VTLFLLGKKQWNAAKIERNSTFTENWLESEEIICGPFKGSLYRMTFGDSRRESELNLNDVIQSKVRFESRPSHVF
jgi:hypothetical protein